MMKDYTNGTPVFSKSIKITETTDPAHADNINAAPKQLLQNTLANRSAIESLDIKAGSAGEYSPETVYAVGDYCVYNNVMYRCVKIKDVEGGEWDPECWEATTVMDAVKKLEMHQEQHYITLPADGWGTEAPYVQAAELSGASTADVPVIGLSLTGDTAAGRKAEKKAWSCVDKAEAGNGVITFTCYDKVPTVDITVIVKGVG